MENIQIKIAFEKNAEKVATLVAEGYCPVECSFGEKNIVDDLVMDHHGKYSDLESVTVRAYRDCFGVRAEDPRFVVNHIDADCIFAIASLAGLLPHPESKYAATLPAFKQAAWKQNLLPLAETIAIIDTDPIGRDILSMPFGEVLICWDSLFGNGADDELAAIGAVRGWQILLTTTSAKTFLEAAKEAESSRRELALADLHKRGSKEGKIMVIRKSRVFGFAEWYDRKPEDGSATDVNGWGNPIVISQTENGNLTFGSPNKTVAEQLFGEGGLLNVFAKLNNLFELAEGSGFGGRESVGGSPRGRVMTEEEVEKIIEAVNASITK